MSMLSAQSDELRTLAGELRQVYEHSTAWLHEEAVTLTSSVDAMCEAADTIESLRDRLQPVPAELDYIEDKSRWFELFGMPDRTVRTIVAVRGECESSGPCYPNCPFGDAPTCPSNCESRDYDALLEWLKQEVNA